MDVLEFHDPESESWMEKQAPKLHLLIGDSIGRDCGLRSRFRRDRFLNEARGGATWATVASRLPETMRRWEEEASAQGRMRGDVVIWLSGNDVYHRQTRLPSFSPETLETAADHAVEVTTTLLGKTENVLVLGPLPRLSGEMPGLRWERSAAFHLERRLSHQLPAAAKFIPLGRQLTKKLHNRYSFRPECAVWYAADGTHLSPEGYAKVADSAGLPVWLKMMSARAGQ